MTIDQAVRLVQQTFPRVYFACHSRHSSRRSRDTGLSARDGDILAHLDVERAIVPSQLARHLGRARSTVSEAIKRLASLGYVTQRADGVALSAQGAAAMRATSVLEPDRLEHVLRRATSAELKSIVRGLAALGDLCHRAVDGDD